MTAFAMREPQVRVDLRLLQRVEEAFHRRVVPAIPFAAHALANFVFPDEI
jgi:hypothetical protein